MDDKLVQALDFAFKKTAQVQSVSSVGIHIGNAGAQLHFAGKALERTIMQSFAGIQARNASMMSGDFQIYLWDASNGTDYIDAAIKNELEKYPQHQTISHTSAIDFQYNPEGKIISLIDFENRRAFYSVPDSKLLPAYEICTPMRMIMNGFCKINQFIFLHAAGIGWNNRGILLIGRGGSGKSTTALLALLNGFAFIGDDYLAVTTPTEKNERRAYAIYRGCKVTPQTLAFLPMLKSYLLKLEQENNKQVLMVNENLGKLVAELPVHLIVYPQVTHASICTFQKLEVMRLLAELGGSTLLQMRGNEGRALLHNISRFCHELPRYALHLSQDLVDVLSSLKACVSSNFR